MLIQTSGHAHASRMLHMLSGLLSLLLDLALICGQIAEGTLIKPEDVIKLTTKPNVVSHISGMNSTILKEDDNVSATYEDEETFQNQENIHHYSRCDQPLLMFAIKSDCLEEFNSLMRNLGKDNWCNWDMVLRHYNHLTYCMEQWAGEIRCYYPNAVVQDMFVEVHKLYFNACVSKEDALPDAPASVVLMLTLLPVSVIPVLVYMVIRKSSVID